MNISGGIYEVKGCSYILKGYNFCITAPHNSTIELLLYEKDNIESNADIIIPFEQKYRLGNVWAIRLSNCNLKNYTYNYRIDGAVIADPYSKALTVTSDDIYRSVIAENVAYNWEDDKKPKIDYSDMIIYRIHVKGFTCGYASKVRNKGTYKAIIEKIPYLKELGITSLELMPVHEFIDHNPNYWGYAGGYYFSPKMSYSSDKKPGGQVIEFKNMVKELHKNGIEVIIEQFYAQGTNPSMVIDSIKYWSEEYHIDGIHIISYNDVEKIIAEVPELADVKIFGNSWWNIDFSHEYIRDNNNLIEYNDSFMNTARMFLKGDENQVNAFINCFKDNPYNVAKVNYISHTNTFTLMDMVSYERKHNEANGENNRDGRDYNNSWNCGIEGATRNRKILALRNRQIKNALCMLFLSQSIPMLLSGDEFGNSQSGNNNPYCQDNVISWLDWRMIKKNSEIFEFVKKLIGFRKKHPVLHQKEQLKLADYKGRGMPDISLHSEKAWYPGMEIYQRHIGILLSGLYAFGEDGNKCDDDIYIAFNMHWEAHSFAIPDQSEECEYEVVIYTGENEVIISNRCVEVEPRSVLVLVHHN